MPLTPFQDFDEVRAHIVVDLAPHCSVRVPLCRGVSFRVLWMTEHAAKLCAKSVLGGGGVCPQGSQSEGERETVHYPVGHHLSGEHSCMATGDHTEPLGRASGWERRDQGRASNLTAGSFLCLSQAKITASLYTVVP